MKHVQFFDNYSMIEFLIISFFADCFWFDQFSYKVSYRSNSIDHFEKIGSTTLDASCAIFSTSVYLVEGYISGNLATHHWRLATQQLGNASKNMVARNYDGKKVLSSTKFLINERAPKISMSCEIASNWATKINFSTLVAQLLVASHSSLGCHLCNSALSPRFQFGFEVIHSVSSIAIIRCFISKMLPGWDGGSPIPTKQGEGESVCRKLNSTTDIEKTYQKKCAEREWHNRSVVKIGINW